MFPVIRNSIIILLAMLFAPLYASDTLKSVNSRPVFQKAKGSLGELYMAVYYPDTIPDTVFNSDGTWDYIIIRPSPEELKREVPYFMKNDSIWINGFIHTNGDYSELENLGVIIGTRWDGRCTARYPLSLLPVIDSLPTVLGIIPSHIYNVPRSPLRGIIWRNAWIEVRGDLGDVYDTITHEIANRCANFGARRIYPDTGRFGESIISYDSLQRLQITSADGTYLALFFEYSGPTDSISALIKNIEEKYSDKKCRLRPTFGNLPVE